MDLKQFVSETLVSLIVGVSEAQKEAKKYGAFINPAGLMRSTSNIAENSIWNNSTNVYAYPVSFDVALTAEDNRNGGAKIKVFSGLLSGEIGGDIGGRNSVASRVQFTVPVLLPEHDIDDPSARKTRKTRKTISRGSNG